MDSPRTKRILIVDDNPELAQSLALLLEMEGHHTVLATDPLAALELARQSSPEVCILDLELPIMDGYELAKRLRETPPTEETMLIALTGYGRDHNSRRAKEAGFAYHLVKPVDLSTLAKILDGTGPTQA
ncbi:MAG TPA: response regulator [Polyangia bacterium]|nr:response regulator [Polyangia bacterium]